jgi:hypothetical protein
MMPDVVALLAAGFLMVLAGALWWVRWLLPGAMTCACAVVLMKKAWS